MKMARLTLMQPMHAVPCLLCPRIDILHRINQLRGVSVYHFAKIRTALST